jgi:hypothetical protein
MNEAFLFIFGIFTTLLAVGPLILAGILGDRENKTK